MNYVRTTFLLAALTGLFLFAGQAIGGRGGMILAFGFACLMNFGAYWFSDRVVLAMSRARPLEPHEAPEIHRIVKDLCTRGGLPMPRLYRIPQASPNAFATGRNPAHAAVAVTDGILRVLTPRELRGVLAHELSHVKNRDILTMSLAATIAGAISMIASIGRFALLFGGFGGGRDDEGGNPLAGLLMLFVAPIAAMLIQMAISRSREFGADAMGARMSGDPLALASALQKLEAVARRVPLATSPTTAHLMIVNPLRAGGGLVSLFRTHPPTAERVRRLEALAGRV